MYFTVELNEEILAKASRMTPFECVQAQFEYFLRNARHCWTEWEERVKKPTGEAPYILPLLPNTLGRGKVNTQAPAIDLYTGPVAVITWLKLCTDLLGQKNQDHGTLVDFLIFYNGVRDENPDFDFQTPAQLKFFDVDAGLRHAPSALVRLGLPLVQPINEMLNFAENVVNTLLRDAAAASDLESWPVSHFLAQYALFLSNEILGVTGPFNDDRIPAERSKCAHKKGPVQWLQLHSRSLKLISQLFLRLAEHDQNAIQMFAKDQSRWHSWEYRERSQR